MYFYSVKDEYQHNNRHKYYLKCHIIFCIKYRKKLLVGKFNDSIKAMLEDIAEKSDFTIEVFESDKDHIHFLISYQPKLSVTSIVRILKQESTIFAWKLFESKLKKEFWVERTLWSDGFFACSIGEASPETIRNYIEQQG